MAEIGNPTSLPLAMWDAGTDGPTLSSPFGPAQIAGDLLLLTPSSDARHHSTSRATGGGRRRCTRL